MKSKKNSIQTFLKLSANTKHTCLLYSEKCSILAYNPVDKFISNDDIKGFKKFIKRHQNKQIIGYLSYDLSYQLYNIKQTAKNDLNLPNIYFLAFDKWQEFKNNKIPKINLTKKYNSTNFKSIITKKEYRDAYKKIKKYLKEGDIYQINFTHRLEGTTNNPPRLLYTKILEKNPVDFAGYIEGDEFEILSASPERFIKICDGRIETQPVKGTRPRGKTEKEDKKFKKELIESEKEAAELNMITDLLRNDIGKISKVGSVKVEGHRLLQKCPTVWHTYSKITGEISVNPIEALISMLPGGSITGCPKKRAMEIIDELEPYTRGVYTGVIGHIEPNGDMDFNIAIRTIIKKNDKLYLQVGGGIVIDSTEEAEFEETRNKASSFMKILC